MRNTILNWSLLRNCQRKDSSLEVITIPVRTHQKMTNNSAKPITAVYLVCTLLLMGPICILDPMKIYESVDSLDEVPESVRLAMAHANFVSGYGAILIAATAVCLASTHQSPRLSMSLIITYWALNIIAQLRFPWPKAEGEPAVTLYGIAFSCRWPFIFLWISVGFYGYFNSAHDVGHKEKAK